MNTPQAFIRQFFKQATFLVSGGVFCFLFILYYFYLEINSAPWYDWLYFTGYSVLMTGLFACILPWLLISQYGEWFYSRAYPKQKLMGLMWREYFIWWGVGFIIFTLWISLLGSWMYVEVMLFFISFTLFCPLLIASQTQLRQQLLGLSLLIFLTLVGFNYFFEEVTTFNLIWPVWLSFLAFGYYRVFNQDEDIEINLPGQLISAEQSWSNTLFKNLRTKPVDLRQNSSSVLQPFWQRLYLLTYDNYWTYQLLFIFFIVSLFFVLSTGLFMVGLVSLEELLDLSALFSFFAIILWPLLLLLIPPRFLMKKKREFLFSRNSSRSSLYFFNVFMQGFFGSLLMVAFLLLSYIPGYFHGDSQLIVSYFTLFFWLYIIGESGLLALFILILVGGSTSVPYLASFLFIFKSSTWHPLVLWLLAFVIRGWDYWTFLNEELLDEKRTPWLFFQEKVKFYALPIVTILGVCIGVINMNPVTWFATHRVTSIENLAFENKRKLIHLGWVDSLEDEWQRETDIQALNLLLKDPYDQKGYLLLAQYYIAQNRDYENPTYDYRYSDGFKLNPDERDFDATYIDLYLQLGTYWLKKASQYQHTYRYQYLESVLAGFNGHYGEAIAMAEKIQKEYPGLISLRNQGWLYYHEFQFDKALEAYKKGLKQESEDYRQYQYVKKIRDIYWENGFYKKAIDTEINFAKTLDEKFDDYYYYSIEPKPYLYAYSDVCQYLHQRQKELKEKITLERGWPLCFNHQNMSKANSGYADGVGKQEMAYWHESRGNFEQALKFYEEATMSEDQSLMYLKMGNPAKARKEIYESLEWKQPFHKMRLSLDKLDNRSDSKFYEYKMFLAWLRLNPHKNKELIAKRLLLTAPHPEQLWPEFEQVFESQPEALEELKTLQARYDGFYDYCESKGWQYLKRKRSIQKTMILFNRLTGSEAKQFKEFKTEIERIFNF